jgi:hypothetical protein
MARGFNEWMVRCGLENNGHPGLDKFINNVGEEATMDLSLHGKIANIPASEVEVVIDSGPPHTIRVRGRVDERMFYGPKLELQTEISTDPGSNSFQIADVITNQGSEEQEFQILYHANYGRRFSRRSLRGGLRGSHLSIPMRRRMLRVTRTTVGRSWALSSRFTAFTLWRMPKGTL